MAATIIPRIKTTTQLNDHSVELQTKDNRAATIYNNLLTYDYSGGGGFPMPGFEYVIPTSFVSIEFNPGSGEMIYGGTGYSSLNSDEKVEFWKWIDKAIVVGLRKYDKVYGL